MKQTAVEWLVDQYKKVGGISISMTEQAKAMEKEQIIDAYEQAMETDIYNEPLKVGEQYYNETYEQFEIIECCPNCGQRENIHTNYDYYQKHRPVENYLCNECGTYFKPISKT